MARHVPSPSPASPEAQLFARLDALRRQWWQRRALEGAAWLAVGVVGALLAAAGAALLVEGVRPDLSTAQVAWWARGAGYLVLLGVAGVWGWRARRQRSDPRRFALYVEERAPALRQQLLTAVEEALAPVEQRPSPALAHRLMVRAAAMLAPLADARALEAAPSRRALQRLALVAGGAALLLGLGPQRLRDAARWLVVPSSTAEAAVPRRRWLVTPGHVTVPRGGGLAVRATADGFAADEAVLLVRRDSTGAWERLPMAPEGDSARFVARLFDVVAPLAYAVEAGGVRSPVWRVAVSDLPAVTDVSHVLQFPAASGLPPEPVPSGDVAAVVGTVVTLRVRVSRPVTGGVVRFDHGARVPLATSADTLATVRFTVSRSGFYRVDLVAEDGTLVAGGVEYVVDAIPDRPPRVGIEEPGRDTKVTNTEEVDVAVTATDDVAVASLALLVRVNGGPEQRVALGGAGRDPAQRRGVHTLLLEELALVPGDLVAYHAVATDHRGQVGSSDVYFLEVRPYSKDYRQAEAGGGGGGGRGGAGDSPEGFVARQRDVVAGTFNWLRDSAVTAPRARREQLATLTLAEGKLRDEVQQQVQRLQERGVAARDTAFAFIQGDLRAAVGFLGQAEEQLGRGQGGAALPLAQRALQQLQRAEARYREVQLQRGGGGRWWGRRRRGGAARRGAGRPVRAGDRQAAQPVRDAPAGRWCGRPGKRDAGGGRGDGAAQGAGRAAAAGERADAADGRAAAGADGDPGRGNRQHARERWRGECVGWCVGRCVG